MDKFSIFCTPEQTKKAIELGAPVKATFLEIPNMFEYKGCPIEIPTAEQMIGFLEERGILIDIHFYCVSWDMGIRTKTGHIISQKMSIDSRKEATLAAIDAALDYLTNNK